MIQGHGDAVVIHSPPTCEVCGSKPGPYVGKLVVAYDAWQFKVHNLDQLECTGFLCPQNYPSWYDLNSVESDVKPQINKSIARWYCQNSNISDVYRTM